MVCELIDSMMFYNILNNNDIFPNFLIFFTTVRELAVLNNQSVMPAIVRKRIIDRPQSHNAPAIAVTVAHQSML